MSAGIRGPMHRAQQRSSSLPRRRHCGTCSPSVSLTPGRRLKIWRASLEKARTLFSGCRPSTFLESYERTVNSQAAVSHGGLFATVPRKCSGPKKHLSTAAPASNNRPGVLATILQKFRLMDSTRLAQSSRGQGIRGRREIGD